ncbi:MAG: SRPBCC domain-containing protein, partial [Pseudomonadota bacterium]
AEQRAVVQMRLGAVALVFDTTVIAQLNAPDHLTVTFNGDGGPDGAVGGDMRVIMSEGDGGTWLDFTVNAAVSGRMTILGERNLTLVAYKRACDFFERFARAVEMAPATMPADPVVLDDGRPAMNPLPLVEETAERIPASSPPPSFLDDNKALDDDDGLPLSAALMWGIFAFAVVILVLIALQ